MLEKIKEVMEKERFMTFFKRSSLFIAVLIAEILFLTLTLDFTGLDLGYVITSTDAHVTVYIFLVVFLIIGYRKLIEVKKMNKLDYKRFIPLVILNLLSVIGFYKLSKFFMANPQAAAQNPLLYTPLWWALAFGIFFSLLFAFYDWKYIVYFSKKFWRRLLVSLGISIVFVTLLKYSYLMWPYLSHIVAKSVYVMLDLFFEGTIYVKEGIIPIVGIPAITAKIYGVCSGIEGMGLFLLLFTVLVLVEYRNLNMKKVLILYLIGVIGAFIINILRTFLIFVMGHFTSAEFALGTFHSNVGWVAFTLYFLVFTYFTYPWMKKNG